MTAKHMEATPSLYHQPMATLEVGGDEIRIVYMVWAPNEKRLQWAANRHELVRVEGEVDYRGEPSWDTADMAHEHGDTFEAVTIAAGFPADIRRAFAGWAIELPVVQP